MKKILCIVCLSCILLTACGNDSSIGIIGGADGPTSVIITEKGEKLAFRITRRRGIYKIDEKDGVPYTHIRITSLRVNSRIALYSQEGVVNGTVKRIVALDPSTDVEPGVTPPIKRPGGH